MLLHELCGRTHRTVLNAVVCTPKIEAPTPRSCGDRGLVAIRLEPRCREDSAVVRATRPWPVFVDRAGVVDQHRAMATFVITEHDVTTWQPRCGEQQPRVDVRQRVRLVGADVHEL